MDIYVVFANFFSFRPWSKRFLTKVEIPFDEGQKRIRQRSNVYRLHGFAIVI